jgi:hypothetical protein
LIHTNKTKAECAEAPTFGVAMTIALRLAMTVTLLSIFALLAQPLPLGEGVEIGTARWIVTALVALCGMVVSIRMYLRRKGK